MIEVPCPCFAEPTRQVILWDSDLLTRGPKGTWTRVNNIQIGGIFIHLSELELVEPMI